MKGYSFQELVKLAEAAVKRAGDVMTGNLAIRNPSGASLIDIDSVVSQNSGIRFKAAGLDRWFFWQDSMAEAGSNAGSNFQFMAYGDNGASLGSIYTVTRSTQILSFAKNPISSDPQSTAANALTRKDYVDSAIAAGDALQVSKTGDTMTGILTLPELRVISTGAAATARIIAGAAAGMMMHVGGVQKWLAYVESATSQFRVARYVDGVYHSDPLSISTDGTVNLQSPTSINTQGTDPRSLTRKDYVDAELAKKLNLAGGTMTGGLTLTRVNNAMTLNVPAGNASYILGQKAEVSNWYVGRGSTSDDVSLYSYIHNNYIVLKSDHVQVAKEIRAPSAEFYGTVGVKPVGAAAHTHIVASTVSGVLMRTGSGVTRWFAYFEPTNNQYRIERYDSSGAYLDQPVIIDSAGNVMLRTPKSQTAQGGTIDALTRKDYVDSAIATGDARQVSKTGDTMTGNLTISNSAPALVLNETDTGKNWFLVADGNGCRFQMDSTDGRNAWDVNSVGAVSLYDPRSATTQGGLADSLTRKDYVDGQVATRAPTTHSHTAAQGNADVISGAWNAIGSMVLAQVYPADTAGIFNPGSRLSGAFLRPCSVDSDLNDMAGLSLPGTWQCQGYARSQGSGEGDWNGQKTLWIRVA